VVLRPPDDTATLFSFVKQPFYHKTLAYTMHEKKLAQETSFFGVK
jgi:hypothetical protein